MKKFLMLVAAIAMVAAFAVPSFSEEAKKPAGPVYGTEVGQLIKPVKIKTVDGKEFEAGKPGEKAMFIFVNSVCSMCGLEMKELAGAKDEFAKIKVYIVSVDMDIEKVKGRYEKIGAIYPVLNDPDYTFGEGASLSSTPATLIIDKDGKIVFKKNGYRSGDLEKLKELL